MDCYGGAFGLPFGRCRGGGLGVVTQGAYKTLMGKIRHLQQLMADRRRVLLDDGRVGQIVKIDTAYPSRATTVSVWTDTAEGPGLAKVSVDDIVGTAEATA